MSKYSKHMAKKAQRKEVRNVNKKYAMLANLVKEQADFNENSTYTSFLAWMNSCADKGLFIMEGNILSIWGSDGINVNETSIGHGMTKAKWNQPRFVDYILENQGYYEEDLSDPHFPYHAPRMKYAEWFYNEYLPKLKKH